MSKILPVFFCIVFCLSCIGKKNELRTHAKTKNEKKELFRLAGSINGKTFKSSDSITIDIVNDSIKPDSCVVGVDGKPYAALYGLSKKISLASLKMGMRRMSVSVYSNGKHLETLPFAVKIIPDVEPVNCKYKIVREYNHDENAYTQGLFYSDGFLYEGTGQKGASSLRKVELETGKVLQKHNLDNQYFGEGICLHKNRIYQLTWQNREGFIYGFNDFELLTKFNYSSEGWGITSDGENLWMSDGTSNLYKLNENMNVTSQIEVYTDKGAVDNLNELEYINGEIWANVYMSDIIVIINPESGRVVGKIDMSNILKKEYIKPSTDVLNGIAYDKTGKRIFVTGKNWAKLFEIEIY
ncbi:MAG: glutaminyl-peptide cyclotransferase [Prevotellaceae bacterium]|jgi:glutamine cyclotransferase|nr:glutaminyl-peptide cyclotransferase [Prevotellaceae bacterium]